ncbi:Pentatricopeptide repeat-containing protein [Arachis hypogaea]|nr:Pentatricopeptide repeat-containing protein [Arachis hypogaea]QHO41274.1 Pentatricopeptide repeat-containing protein [Arachis hypogaea]QHO41275.1 Pentatricopeptide repeat-containing protein [Arachis hypogaea]
MLLPHDPSSHVSFSHWSMAAGSLSWNVSAFFCCHQSSVTVVAKEQRIGIRKLVILRCKGLDGYRDRSSFAKKSDIVFHDMNVDDCLPKMSTLSAEMLYYAESGFIPQAHTIWEQLVNSSFVPSIKFISKLFDGYEKHRNFNGVLEILHYVSWRNFGILPHVYSLAISCFGRGGQLELMEETVKEMVSRGFRIGSKTGNAFLLYYCIFGSLKEMENAYARVKRSGFMINEEAIRAMASAYIRERKFYHLGEFLRDVGLGRKNVGNLLWNLMLLSYAANFKMKSLQREFLRMVEAGFRPDVTTFNIRALAFSRMSLFWDLHLSIEHMVDAKVIPDLVIYGCVVDAYLDKKLGKNLYFALNKLNLDHSPQLLTDPLVFEAFGKGDFHTSAEAFLEFKTHRQWTYRVLVQKYLKKILPERPDILELLINWQMFYTVQCLARMLVRITS